MAKKTKAKKTKKPRSQTLAPSTDSTPGRTAADEPNRSAPAAAASLLQYSLRRSGQEGEAQDIKLPEWVYQPGVVMNFQYWLTVALQYTLEKQKPKYRLPGSVLP